MKSIFQVKIFVFNFFLPAKKIKFQIFFGIFHKDVGTEQIRRAICDLKPTFYPIKIYPEMEFANKSDVVKISILKNKFNENSKWKPTTIEDYV